MSIEIRAVPREGLADLLVPVTTGFGIAPQKERVERMAALPELDTRFAAFDGDTLVGGAASFSFDLTVPGGVAVPIAGLTLVGVLPTHRRRGILRAMMAHHLDDVRRRGLAVSGLFASEGAIYGRFGYGLASWSAEFEIPRDRTAFLGTVPASRARLVSEAEANAAFPAIWERVRLTRPGMLTRSDAWWSGRRTGDPDWMRAGRPPLQRVLIEIDGRPAAYALYRFGAAVGHRDPGTPLDIVEAVADSPGATRALFRYLLDIDIVATFRATLQPPDHPLLHILVEPRRLGMRLSDGLWLRIVDVGAALSKRGYGPGGPLVIEVHDDMCQWNTGSWRIEGGVAERTGERPDLVMRVDALGAVYLGGTTFGDLVRAGRVTEERPGAALRGDALFRGSVSPWCPEIF